MNAIVDAMSPKVESGGISIDEMTLSLSTEVILASKSTTTCSIDSHGLTVVILLNQKSPE